MWIRAAFGPAVCLMPVCVCVCVCVWWEQLRYRACRGREVISAEDDCIIWTADQRRGSKWREAGELVRPAAAC